MREVAILQVEPINFHLRSDEQKKVTISAFQKFLNALDFPVQLLISTDSLNLDQYLGTLQEGVAPQFQELFRDFTDHLNSITGNLLNRSFYVVIPKKDNLAIQVEVCHTMLSNMNLRTRRLQDEEIKLLVASFSHDNYAEDQKSSLLPSIIRNNSTDLQIDANFVRCIVIKDYPRRVEEGFLDKLVTLNGNLFIALHIDPFPLDEQMIMLNRELQKQRADLWSMENQGTISPSLEIQFQDTRAVLEQIQKGTQKLFNLSVYILCKAGSKKELEFLSKKVESELNALMLVPTVPKFEQHLAFKSILPLGKNELRCERNVTTSALSAFFPFTSQFLDVDQSGILLGLNKNNIPIIKDIFKLYNANGVVLASSGGGKSYFTKLMIARQLLSGTKVMVVDPQAEYIELVKKFQGQLVTISRTSKTIINPLDLMGHPYDEKKLTLLELLPIMIGDMSEVQKAVMDRALTAVYDEAGITNNPRTWRRRPPIMGDVVRQLKRMSKTASKVEMDTYRSLINRLEMYVSGVFGFLNTQTNLNFNNQFVCFDIADLPTQVKPTIMFLVLDFVYMKMKQDRERKMLVIDEAWSLLERSEDEGYVFKIVKTCRKFNLGLLLITQDVGDLLRNDAGRALLNNSEYTLLLRQKPSIIKDVKDTFHLSGHESDRLLTATTGEGILIIANEHSEIKIIASPQEHEVITTNADELLARTQIVTEFEESPVDFGGGFFKRKDVTQEIAQELIERGYRSSLHIGLYGGRREEYLLKPPHNESCEHFFVVKVIEEHVKKFSDVQVNATNGADVVFTIGRKKIGVEVETGNLLRKVPKKLKEKVERNHKRYDEWFFVVTNVKRDKDKYTKLHHTLARREVPERIRSYFLSSENKKKKVKSANSNSRSRRRDTPKSRGIGTQRRPINIPPSRIIE